jgi:predicted enzyme related to lactoylglutathione lyase
MTKVKNTICWADIPVLDLDRASKFYSKILNEPVEIITAHGFKFALLSHKDDNVAGCLTTFDNRTPSSNGILIYLEVTGFIDQAISAATLNGGTVTENKTQIGEYGFRALIQDTEGNIVALYSKTSE